MDEDTTLIVADGAAGNLLSNATDAEGNPLAITSFTINGIVGAQAVDRPVSIPGVGILTINSNGSYTFAPATDYNGTVPLITYTVSDGHGGTDTSTLSLFVTPVEDPVLPLTTPSASVPQVLSGDSSRFQSFDADGSIVVPVVNEAVHLRGTPAIEAHGIVVSTVNAVRDLGSISSGSRQGQIWTPKEGLLREQVLQLEPQSSLAASAAPGDRSAVTSVVSEGTPLTGATHNHAEALIEDAIQNRAATSAIEQIRFMLASGQSLSAGSVPTSTPELIFEAPLPQGADLLKSALLAGLDIEGHSGSGVAEQRTLSGSAAQDIPTFALDEDEIVELGRMLAD